MSRGRRCSHVAEPAPGVLAEMRKPRFRCVFTQSLCASAPNHQLCEQRKPVCLTTTAQLHGAGALSLLVELLNEQRRFAHGRNRGEQHEFSDSRMVQNALSTYQGAHVLTVLTNLIFTTHQNRHYYYPMKQPRHKE